MNLRAGSQAWNEPPTRHHFHAPCLSIRTHADRLWYAAEAPCRYAPCCRKARARDLPIYLVTDAEEIERVLKSYRDFVALCARKEQETGIPCLIIASW